MLFKIFERFVWFFFGLSLIFLVTHNWYDDFYCHLSDSPSSYRLLHIWVQGDKPDNQITPIGGSKKEMRSWLQGVDYFLSQAASRHKNGVILELISDKKTFEAYNHIINHLSQSYPNNFKISLVDDVIKDLPAQEFLSYQCSCGLPASCSDLLRIFALEQENTISVYMDIDTFIYRLAHQKKPFADFDVFSVTSSHAYGLKQEESGIFMGSHQKSTQESSMIQINNDFIVSKPGSGDWPLIQASACSQIYRYSPYIRLLNQRSDIDGYSSYQNNLNERVLWMQNNPQTYIDFNCFVLDFAGPAFWSYFFDTDKVRGYMLPYLYSSAQWASFKGSEIKGFVSYSMLLTCFEPAQAQDLTKIILLTHDISYYTKRNSSFLLDLKKEAGYLWSHFSKEQQILAKNFFHDALNYLEDFYEPLT